jgi:hyaluronan synthase
MHEIIITIDSDSIVLPKSIKNLVAPFMHDKNIGAVAGNVKVLNHHKGIIPRMLDVSFNYSFDFIRAGQSHIDAVLVTPGALSAYRADLLHKVKDKWLNQHFLGVKVNIGEDRAMNNFIVSLGYRTVYQKNAQVFTNVPTSYTNLCKMYLRWTRSNIRETILMSGFLFKDFRQSDVSGLRAIYILHLIGLFVPVILKIQIIMAILINPSILLIQLLAGTLLVSTIPVMIYGFTYKSKNALWGFLYSLFYLFTLFWITPYALFTLRNNYWMTKK